MKSRLPILVAEADVIAISGVSLGLISLLNGWFTFKINRLSQGEHFTLYEVIGIESFVFLALLWLVCLGLSFRSQHNWSYILLGTISNIILLMTAIIVAASASSLLQDTPASARVSLGGGFWLSILAIYFVIFAAYKGIKKRVLYKLAITLLGIIVTMVMLFTGAFDQLSVMMEYASYQERFNQELIQHLFLAGISVSAAGLAGVTLGIWAARRRKAGRYIFGLTSVFQTIPSLALFGLMIAPLSFLAFQFPFLRDLGIRGIGTAPAVIALFIYALLPIVRNTYVGLRQIDQSIIDAGSGMGMNQRQIFRRIEVPLSAPLVLEGIRIASVQAIGLAAVAALIGAGGLGWFIFQGLGQAAPDMILLGTLPIIFLAIVIDGLMRLVVSIGSPQGNKRSDA